MLDRATDSEAPAQGHPSPPEARGLSVNQAAGKLGGLFAPEQSEEQPPEEAAPEGDTELSDAAEGEPQAQEEALEQPTYKVRVNGEELDVPLDELLRGYSRTADYTRKTQTVAEERKALEAELEKARVERSQYEQALEWAKSQLQSQQREPDWQKLIDEDPIEYVKQKEAWRDRKEQLAAVEAEQRRIAEQRQAEMQAMLAKKVQEETERLFSLIPEWRDSSKATADKAKLLEYGMNMGFAEQELSQVYDHRAVLLLRKSMLYDELMAKGQRKLAEAPAKSPATARPGSPAVRQGNRELDSAKAQLKTSGRVTDAQKVLERMFASR